MGFLSSLEGAGKTLADVSGGTAVFRALEHPLNLGNDAKAALVIGSYLLGGPMARAGEVGAAGLAGRLLGRRMMEAAPVAEGSALHAAWGSPKMSPSSPLNLISKLLGKKVPGNGALTNVGKDATQPGVTKGMFFNAKMGGLPHAPDAQHQIADGLTQAADPFMGEAGKPMAFSEPYGLHQAAGQARMRVMEGSGPPSYHPDVQSTEQMVSNSKPLWEAGQGGPNTKAIDAHMLAELLKQQGYRGNSISNMSVNPVEIIKWLAKQKKLTENGLLHDMHTGEPQKLPVGPLIGGGVGYGALLALLGKGIYDKTK